MATTKRFDAVTPRPKHNADGVWWHRVGRAVQNEKGQIAIYLDSVPVPDQERGNIVIMLFEAKERDEQEANSRRRTTGETPPKSRPTTQIDDEIPF